MKYVAVLVIAGGIFLYLGRPPGGGGVKISPSMFQPEGAGTDFLKEPLDRTHEVLKQAKTRAQDPALQ